MKSWRNASGASRSVFISFLTSHVVCMDDPSHRLEGYSASLRKKKRDTMLREKRIRPFSTPEEAEHWEALRKLDSRLANSAIPIVSAD